MKKLEKSHLSSSDSEPYGFISTSVVPSFQFLTIFRIQYILQTVLSWDVTEFDLCGIFSMILLTACEQVARFMKKPLFHFSNF